MEPLSIPRLIEAMETAIAAMCADFKDKTGMEVVSINGPYLPRAGMPTISVNVRVLHDKHN
jgi:hypothetical protein